MEEYFEKNTFQGFFPFESKKIYILFLRKFSFQRQRHLVERRQTTKLVLHLRVGENFTQRNIAG